jgi:hypothetical protein
MIPIQGGSIMQNNNNGANHPPIYDDLTRQYLEALEMR